MNQKQRRQVLLCAEGKRAMIDDRKQRNEDATTYGVMGEFTISLGQDEKGHYISYYDLWNLEKSVEGEKGLLGKSFEIYDRIHYDPNTYEVIH